MHSYPVHKSFLEQLDLFHSSHAYTRDVPTMAAALGARVITSSEASTMHEDTQGRPLLVIRTHNEYGRISSGRMMFSAMHELAHLLFLRLDDGILARLFNKRFGRFPHEYKRRLEGICNDAASRLRMPDVLLMPAVKLHGHSPKAVLELSRG